MVSLSVCPLFFNKNEDRQVLEDKWENQELDVPGIVKILSEGHPICVSALKSNLHNEGQFQSAQVVGVDFDNGPDINYFMRVDAFTKKYAAIAYSTVNSTVEKPRTRLLFVLEKPVIDPLEYKRQVNAILGRFRPFKVDEVCKSAVQVFFGNSKGEYLANPEAVVPAVLVEELAVVNQKPAADTDKKKASEVLVQVSSNGSRNNDAVTLVARYANVLPAADIEAIMHLWYDRLPDKTDFPFSSVQTIIRHYTEKSATILRSVENTVHSAIQPQKIVELKKLAIPFYDFKDTTGVQWLIENWLPVATTAMMVAPPGHFKTWISLAMAMSLGMNKPLFGEFKVTKPCRVLVMQQEDSRHITSTRSNLIWEELSKSNPRPRWSADKQDIYTGIILPAVHYYASDTTFTFSSQDGLKNLEALIKDQNYGLVIIDPLYATSDSADYMAKDANRMVELKRIRDRLGTSFLVLHHTRKTTTAPTMGQPLKANRLDAWGSQFLNAWQETGIQIRGTDDPKSMAITRNFKSSGDVFTGVFSFDIATEGEPRFNVTNVQAKDGAKISIMDILVKGPVSVTDYARLAGISTSTASRQLAKMAQKGTVKKLANQSYVLNQDESDQ